MRRALVLVLIVLALFAGFWYGRQSGEEPVVSPTPLPPTPVVTTPPPPSPTATDGGHYPIPAPPGGAPVAHRAGEMMGYSLTR